MNAEQLSPATQRKLTLRVVCASMLLYLLAYIDRVNIGFAALQMNADLGLTPKAFGFAAAVFGISYIATEIPSSLLLYRYGARVWFTRILITWGMISGATCFVQNATQLYVVRFLLGAAEAGLYPGIVYYVAQWIPLAHRGRAMAIMVTAGPLAVVLGAPMSGLLMASMDNVGGISGWRWMFFIEALPSVIAGIVVWLKLVDKPEQAPWLDDAEKKTLIGILAKEHASNERKNRSSFVQVLRNPMVLMFALLAFCGNSQAVAYWLPQIVNKMGAMTKWQVGLVTAVPYMCAFLFMRVAARYSDRTGKRDAALIACYCAATVGLIASAYLSPVFALVGISIAATALWSLGGPFNAWATSNLTGTAAAGGMALINSVAQIAGTVLPYAVGVLTGATHDFKAGLLLLAGVPTIGIVLALTIKRMQGREGADSDGRPGRVPA